MPQSIESRQFLLSYGSEFYMFVVCLFTCCAMNVIDMVITLKCEFVLYECYCSVFVFSFAPCSIRGRYKGLACSCIALEKYLRDAGFSNLQCPCEWCVLFCFFLPHGWHCNPAEIVHDYTCFMSPPQIRARINGCKVVGLQSEHEFCQLDTVTGDFVA